MRVTTHDETAPALRFENVHVRFHKAARSIEAVGGVDFTVGVGEFVALIGPSGCGKSTLLNVVAGLRAPSMGRVVRDGSAVSGIQRRIGYVTQKDNLLPWRNTRSNVGIALELRGTPSRERETVVAEYMTLVGLTGFEEHYPNELSGGMRKRASLARTLVAQPDLLLMDEPFGAVDAQLKLVLQDELLRIWERHRRTVLFVTHDLQEAVALADRVVVLSSRPARVKKIMAIDIPRPRDLDRVRFTPRFGELSEILWQTLRSDVSN